MKPKLVVASQDPKAYTWGAWAERKYNALVERLKRTGQKFGKQALSVDGFTILLSYANGLGKIIVLGGSSSEYVGVLMPNPVPYRGVSLGSISREPRLEVAGSGLNQYGGTNYVFCDVGPAQLCSYAGYTIYDSFGAVVSQVPLAAHQSWLGLAFPGTGINGSPPQGVVNWPFDTGGTAGTFYFYGGAYSATPRWQLASVVQYGTGVVGTFAPIEPSYESILAADTSAGAIGASLAGVASDGQVIGSELTVYAQVGPSAGDLYGFGSTLWSGGSSADIFNQLVVPKVYDHKLTFTVPEDCVYPITEAPPAYPGGAPAFTYTVQNTNNTPNGYSQTSVLSFFSGPSKIYELVGSYELVAHPDYPEGPFPIGVVVATVTKANHTSGGVIGSGVTTQTTTTQGLAGATIQSSEININIEDSSDYAAAYATYLAGLGPLAAEVARWNADWAAGVAEGKARRKAWFKKNSTTTIENLKTGVFPLPAAWDYQIKFRAPDSLGTYQPVPLTATFTDVFSDGALEGQVVYTRTVVMSYSAPVPQADGSVAYEPRAHTVVGTRTETTTIHTIPDVFDFGESVREDYVDWYEPTSVSTVTGAVLSTGWREFPCQFIEDRNTRGPALGLLWNGVVQHGYRRNSEFETTAQLFPAYPLDKSDWVPPYPAYSNTLVGTAPQFFLDYHASYPPVYEAGVGVIAGNNSSLYNVTTITLTPFGLVKNGEPLGMFADPSDAAGATQFEYYGTFTYSFDWQTGALQFSSFSPLRDAGGNIVASKIADFLPGTALPAYNCVVKYSPLTWEDVKTTASATKTARAEGQGDRALAAILDAIS